MKITNRLVFAMSGLILTAASSHADFATVQDIWPSQPAAGTGSEWNLYYGAGSTGVSGSGTGIMEYLYGSDYSRITVNGSDPTQWMGTSGSGNFVAVYAGDSEALYTAGLSGTPISGPIVGGQGTAGNPPSINGGTSFTPASNPFLFMDWINSGSIQAFSDPALNGGTDRMVTFQVTGTLNTPGNINSGYTSLANPTYVIAFEDGSDFDYNDLVVQVSGVAPVPEPTTLISGALMMMPFGAGMVSVLRRKLAA